MVRWGGIALIAISILHMIVLGLDAIPEAQGWLRFELWTSEHNQAFRSQPPHIAVSGAAFWSTIGSFAIPLMVLGAWVVWADTNDHPIPSFVGWALLAWVSLAALILEFSGFPFGIPMALAIIIGTRRNNRAPVKS